jgi:hypothetical protein
MDTWGEQVRGILGFRLVADDRSQVPVLTFRIWPKRRRNARKRRSEKGYKQRKTSAIDVKSKRPKKNVHELLRRRDGLRRREGSEKKRD